WLTQSRSAMLGLAAAIAVLVTIRARTSKATYSQLLVPVFAAGGLAACFLFLEYIGGAEVDLSTSGHIVSLADSLPQMFGHPIGYGVGQVGPRAYLFTNDPILVESFLLLIGLEAGPFVLLLYFVLLFSLVVLSLRGRTMGIALIAVAIASSIPSQLVLPSLQDGSTSYTLWIAVGLGLAALREERAGLGNATEKEDHGNRSKYLGHRRYVQQRRAHRPLHRAVGGYPGL
ncbi:hypothetical protein ACP3TI_13720, partial [Desulforudis sp. 1190]